MTTQKDASRAIAHARAREAVVRGVEFIECLSAGQSRLARVSANVDIACGNTCALAQATGMPYVEALTMYRITHEQARHYGFNEGPMCSVSALTTAWREWVASRT